jgi:hypothetical protein
MAEAALGVVGLLLAFKGAVDGYLFIDSLMEVDGSQRYLCIRYIVERHKLTIWGDYFRVNDKESCSLCQHSLKVREIK